MSSELAQEQRPMFGPNSAPPQTRKDLALRQAECARYSGAAIRSDTLVIATVEGCAMTGFKLCLEQSAQIELEDRDQEALRWFCDDLQSFIRDAGLKRILLRGPPKTGKFRTGLAFKIEAVLQLLPELEVEVVHFNRVDSWTRHSQEVCPEPIDGLAYWERDAHRSAIATACFGEMYAAQRSAQAKSAAADQQPHDVAAIDSEEDTATP